MKTFSIFAFDTFALYLSLYLTLLARYGLNLEEQLDIHIWPFSIIFVMWLFVFYIFNLYEIKYLKNSFDFYSRFYQGILLSGAIAVFFFYLIPFFIITPKTNLFIFIIIFSITDFFLRYLYNHLISSATFKNDTIIVGLNQQALELTKFIKENPQLGYNLKYIVDISEEKAGQDLSEYGIISSSDLDRIIKEEKISTVILSPLVFKLPKLIDSFYRFLHKKINFYNFSEFYEITTGKIPLGAIDQAWFLENITRGNKKLYEISKRIVDIFFSLLLGIFFLGLLPFISLLIKFNSKGPIFYRQKRVGQYGKEFIMYKFRTMANEAEKESGAVWAQKDDKRITGIGRLMRKTRLDELPQVWNILKGHMSFVGPRAERPELDEKLKKEIPFYQIRHIVKPGITGWAQVNFPYGNSTQDALEKLQYDLYYIKNRSLILDLKILLKTINVISKGGTQ